MTIGEYQALARRTQNPNLTKEERRQHALYGLVSEITEVMVAESRESLIKELGDVCWFASELCDVENWSIAPFVDSAISLADEYEKADFDDDELVSGLIMFAGKICGAFQKVYQGHELDRREIRINITYILGMVMTYAKHLAVEDDIKGIMSANIEKLRRRFPDGFDAERSIHREE